MSKVGLSGVVPRCPTTCDDALLVSYLPPTPDFPQRVRVLTTHATTYTHTMTIDVSQFRDRPDDVFLVKTKDGAALAGRISVIGSRPTADITVGRGGNVYGVENHFIQWIKPFRNGGNQRWEWVTGYDEGDTEVEVWFRSSGGAEHRALYRKAVGFVGGPGPVNGGPVRRVQEAGRVPDDIMARCAEDIEELMADA